MQEPNYVIKTGMILFESKWQQDTNVKFYRKNIFNVNGYIGNRDKKYENI